MPIQLSPSVVVVEKDLTNVVPAVSVSVGATIVNAAWGPVMDITTINSENVLAQRFGRPNDYNAADWFTAANYLSYSNNLLVVRPETNSQRNAVATLTGTVTGLTITAGGSGYHADTTTATVAAPAGVGGVTATVDLRLADRVNTITVSTPGSGYVQGSTFATISAPVYAWGVQATASVTVVGGEITAITVTEKGKGYSTGTPPVITITGPGTGAVAVPVMESGVVESATITNPGTGYAAAPAITIADSHGTPGTGATITSTFASGGIKILNQVHYDTYFSNGQGIVGEFAAKYPGSLGNSLKVSMADAGTYADWAYANMFESAPETSTWAAANGASSDEMHIVVVDTTGKWSGVAGSVLETFGFVSKASDAKSADGATSYYKNVINNSSKYVWWMDHPATGTNWGQAANNQVYASMGASAITLLLSGGVDSYGPGVAGITDANKMNAFELFSNDEEWDVNLIAVGKASPQVAKFVVDNVAEVRKDCLVFVSPQHINTGEPIVGTTSQCVEDILAFRNAFSFNVNSSYAVLDSGYKYQYDRYNDVYRWVPLNGDIAGLCARTDETNDPWWSPAGLNRGQIKNVVKLAFSPRKVDRDNLYKSGVNPVVSFPGQGTVLYGDKTLLAKPSAFDRINVRRLFIVLEKAIATAAKYQLFEFNDGFTRAQFRNMVEPYLRDVKGRRGVYDYKVVCDTSNNTGEVIDGNRFVADIYIKPARSINFIQLNFIATRTGADFTEIAG